MMALSRLFQPMMPAIESRISPIAGQMIRRGLSSSAEGEPAAKVATQQGRVWEIMLDNKDNIRTFGALFAMGSAVFYAVRNLATKDEIRELRTDMDRKFEHTGGKIDSLRGDISSLRDALIITSQRRAIAAEEALERKEQRQR